jgi:inorganic pyrophosphatase
MPAKTRHPVDLMKVPLRVTVLLGAIAGCAPATQPGDDPYTHPGDTDFLTDIEAVNPDGTVNVVVEIPTGTTAKWEVTKPDGRLEWELEDGAPRVVAYLGYPGNYGMVPRTLLPEELGGDGDPLDVIVLGEAVPRGRVVRTRIVGVLKLLDDGEQDDKLIAVREDTPFWTVDDMTGLEHEFPGAREIVETWFTYYKGRGEMESKGTGDAATGRAILEAARKAFRGG